jgi:hypothetical protein
MIFLQVFVMLVTASSLECTSQDYCLSQDGKCIRVTIGTDRGLCIAGKALEPSTSTVSTSLAASPTPVSCGNSTLCKMGQVCLDQKCEDVPAAVKTFFTPTVIAIISASALLVCCGGSLLICRLCKCCCFAGRTKISPSSQHLPPDSHAMDPAATKYITHLEADRHDHTIEMQPLLKSQNQGPAPLPASYQSPPKQRFLLDEIIKFSPQPSPQYHQLVPPPPIYIQPMEILYHQDNPSTLGPYQDPNSSGQAIDIFGSPLEGHQSKEENEIDSPSVLRDLPPAAAPGLLGHKPVMNQKIGPIVSSIKQPPSTPGFFGYWDKSGQYHQGFTDSAKVVYGGVFDDQCNFHFGQFGIEDPVRVEDDMMAKPQHDTSTPSITIDFKLHRSNTGNSRFYSERREIPPLQDNLE